MSKRLSLQQKIVLHFTPLHILIGIGLACVFGAMKYQNIVERDRYLREMIADLSREHLAARKHHDLAATMEEAVEHEVIDFYTIRRGTKPIYHRDRSGLDPNLKIVAEADNETFEFLNYEVTTAREKDLVLDVGNKVSADGFMGQFLKNQLLVYVIEVAAVALLLYIASGFGLRDILNLAQSFSVVRLRRGVRSLFTSKEGAKIGAGLYGYEGSIDNLATDKLVHQRQIPKSILKELKSGRKTPYRIDVSMVRTDINGFSGIFNRFDPDVVIEVIGRFFTEAEAIIERNGGSVHETAGDEIIYLFRDEDCGNSSASALAAVDEINQLADQFDRETMKEHGFPFRVKSSLSCGWVRFGLFRGTLDFSGEPFIRTNRLLSVVDDKHVNTVVFADEVRERIDAFCEYRRLGVFRLKGYPDESEIYSLSKRTSLGDLLSTATEASFDKAGYYRSDLDVCAILQFIKRSFRQLSAPLIIKLISHLSRFQLSGTSTQTQQAYSDLLLYVLDQESIEDHGKWIFTVSSILMSAKTLLTPESINMATRSVIYQALWLNDNRVVANVLEVLMILDPGGINEARKRLKLIQNNRVRANALVMEARAVTTNREWAKRIGKPLRSMLESGDPLFRASGLFALGECALFAREQDPSAFYANESLQGFLTRLHDFGFSENPMVRRQAMRAAWKAGYFSEFWASLSEKALSPEHRHELDLFLRNEGNRPPIHALGKTRVAEIAS